MEETTPDQSKKKVILPLIVILLMIIGVLMVIKASVQKEVRLNSQPIEMAEGNEIPNLELTFLDGSKKKLSDLPHRLMLVNFWATWCEACMEEMPSMVSLRNKYASQGFEVLAVNVDEDPAEAVPPVVKKMGMNFPVLIDPKNSLSEMFDVHAIPLSVVINKNQKIMMIESGGRDWNDEETNQLVEKWLKE